VSNISASWNSAIFIQEEKMHKHKLLPFKTQSVHIYMDTGSAQERVFISHYFPNSIFSVLRPSQFALFLHKEVPSKT
jgi:hypothetical protein